MKLSHAIVFCAVGLLMASGCTVEEREEYTYSHNLGGKDVAPDVLNVGSEQYMLYCYACHGTQGDGRGPASANLRPAPRDFRQSLFKFTKNDHGAGTLPSDEAILHLLKTGLHGTAMLPWEDIPDPVLLSVIQYIKTFAPDCEGAECVELGWRDGERKIANAVGVGCDPFSDEDINGNGTLDEGEDCNQNEKLDAARPGLAVQRGETLYHSKQNCQKCHSAYIAMDRIVALGGEMVEPIYYPKLQKSEYSLPIPGHPIKRCGEEAHCDKTFYKEVERWSCVQPRTCVGGPFSRSACKTDVQCTDDESGEAGVCTETGSGICQECVEDIDCGGTQCAEAVRFSGVVSVEKSGKDTTIIITGEMGKDQKQTYTPSSDSQVTFENGQKVARGAFLDTNQTDANQICAQRYNSDRYKCAADGFCADCGNGICPEVGNNCVDHPEQCNRRVCNFGVCEQMAWIAPREFERGKFRGGNALEDVYRTLKSGIGGTEMIRQSEDDEELWALAYYVRHLASTNTSPIVREERRKRLEDSLKKTE